MWCLRSGDVIFTGACPREVSLLLIMMRDIVVRVARMYSDPPQNTYGQHPRRNLLRASLGRHRDYRRKRGSTLSPRVHVLFSPWFPAGCGSAEPSAPPAFRKPVCLGERTRAEALLGYPNEIPYGDNSMAGVGVKGKLLCKENATSTRWRCPMPLLVVLALR